MKTTCGIFLLYKEKILIAHPTNHAPDQWDIPKGCQDKDETYWQTAKRELGEETGIHVTELSISKIVEPAKFYHYRNKKKRLYPFFIELNKGLPRNPICKSMVTEIGGKKLDEPFPEIDAFTWADFSKIHFLHHSQVAALNDYLPQHYSYLGYEKSENYG